MPSRGCNTAGLQTAAASSELSLKPKNIKGKFGFIWCQTQQNYEYLIKQEVAVTLFAWMD